MAKQDTSYAWVGWTVAIVIGLIFIISLYNRNNDNGSRNAESSSSWSCTDATSYNQNAYDDNRCTDGNETRYVSDSEARSLDPDYSPGQSGARYYNSR